jgi:hypothetical protein
MAPLSDQTLARLQEFITTNAERGPEYKINCKEFRVSFNMWNSEAKDRVKGFKQAMRRLGYVDSTVVYGPERKMTGVYHDIRLKQIPSVGPKEAELVPPEAEQQRQSEGPAEQEPKESEPVPQEPPQAEQEKESAGPDLILRMTGEEFGEFAGGEIRKTNEHPPRASVYDTISSMTGNANPRKTWSDAKANFGEKLEWGSYQFPGEGQRPTPVMDATGMVNLMNLLPGRRAAKFRQACAKIVVRFLGGDETLISQIRANRGAQSPCPRSTPPGSLGRRWRMKASSVRQWTTTGRTWRWSVG